MDKKERDLLRQKRHAKLLDKHGWKLNVPPSTLPDEDKAPLNGGLRCFKKVPFRDDYGNRIDGTLRTRCKNCTTKGSLFCKKHGGGNSNALVHGKRAVTSSLYRGAFKSDVGDLFDAFINDPTIYDLRPELAALRTCSLKWIQEMSGQKSRKQASQIMRTIRRLCKDESLSEPQKFLQIRDFCLQQSSMKMGNQSIVYLKS